MAGPMRKLEWTERFRGEVRAGLRLSPWLLLALLFALVLSQAEPTARAGLFQSSPADTPAVPPTGTSEVVPSQVPTMTLTPGLTSTPTLTSTPGLTSTPTLLPSDTPTVLPSETPTLTPTLELPADEGVATPEPTMELEERPDPSDQGRYAEGESNLIFDWGMLFDAVALGLSYVWLCCGGLIVVAVPLVFVVLWVASARRKRTEE